MKAIETCFPRSERQRCLALRMRNLAAKVPEDRWPEFKARATAAYQAPSRAIARDLAAGLVKDYEAELPSAVACFMDDFEAAIAHLRMPITHRRAIRTTNLLERLFVEERRRLKIIPMPSARSPFSSSCWRHDPSCRAVAGNQDHRLRAPPDDRRQAGTRSGIRGPKRPRHESSGKG
ncbi:MAG: hypothetical protein E5V16_26845, partial [Mesorhizobium sp.]